MKRVLVLIAATWAMGGAVALASQSASFSQVDLFQRGERGVNTYRIPALTVTRHGVLIAVVDARRDSPRDLPAHISLAMRRSVDGGRNWQPARTIVEVAQGGVSDASLLTDRVTGRVWCFFTYGPPGIGFATAKAGGLTGPSTLQVHAMYSDNDGDAWSTPVDLTPQIRNGDRSWQAVFAASGADIETNSGRLLLPLVVRDGNGVVHAMNAYSDDHGVTWKHGAPIGAGTDESHEVELSHHVILQNMRDGTHRKVARSTDGGLTFSTAVPDPALVDPGCNAGLVRYRRGHKDVLVFTNAASRKRENLTVKLSYDGGKTWPVSRTINAGPSGYSAVVQLRDGALGVLYERGDSSPSERITFARFDLGWVTWSAQ